MTRIFTRLQAGLLTLAFALVAPLAVAQTYPDYVSTTVNDFAGILSPDTEQRITDQLNQLYEDTGIEMTVATLSRKEVFAPDQSLEDFATGMFDQWGIGDSERNDGILFLILRGDRELRIELGAGYGREWDAAAQRVLDRDVIPDLKNDDYETGIPKGVTGIITDIATPFHEGKPAPKGGVSGWWAALIAIPAFMAMFWGMIRDKLASFRKCPQCGERKLNVARKVLRAATREMQGEGERITSCANCGYRDVHRYSIAKRSKKSSSRSSFGGGRSGGGGASGKF
ncbi:TPM domain-containing protein [Rhodalgimonas zhirmunskyi]|uniref:TPM domain-containing protein n=1 Tax=Rhodalgimonas zhirmunskyi TaxID=2964767 RepID=A0AAJ1UB26_9RHOB|nr:TPM domain-containing protein [Rhodoalgimonas zhirmunskyi]MDQ2092592.1 TPM domain-containing protein [Rhodoalgimonas zhirmunskyi]